MSKRITASRSRVHLISLVGVKPLHSADVSSCSCNDLHSLGALPVVFCRTPDLHLTSLERIAVFCMLILGVLVSFTGVTTDVYVAIRWFYSK